MKNFTLNFKTLYLPLKSTTLPAVERNTRKCLTARIQEFYNYTKTDKTNFSNKYRELAFLGISNIVFDNAFDK